MHTHKISLKTKMIFDSFADNEECLMAEVALISANLNPFRVNLGQYGVE
jgi:hypothetical protein